MARMPGVRRMIHGRAGISLHESKHAIVYSRLSRRRRDTGHTAFGPNLDELERMTGAKGEAKWQALVNGLTTTLAKFFREEHHFQALRDGLATRHGRALRIWCNAATTGEEPHSIAMTIANTRRSDSAQVSLLCTDIDTTVLETARRGVYPADARGPSPEMLKNTSCAAPDAIPVITACGPNWRETSTSGRGFAHTPVRSNTHVQDRSRAQFGRSIPKCFSANPYQSVGRNSDCRSDRKSKPRAVAATRRSPGTGSSIASKSRRTPC
jgi:CheR methyltransferase, SAM binding domain/CheR methyltransferase, all-alpha domain